jgi:hypothetical protein
MFVELFAIMQTEWKSELTIAPLVAATNGSGIHALVGIIVSTIARKRLLQDFQAVLTLRCYVHCLKRLVCVRRR